MVKPTQDLVIEGSKVAVEQAREAETLGDVIWYSVQEQTIPFEDYEKLLAAEGVPKDYWPSRTRTVDAFKAAVHDLHSREYFVDYETVIDPVKGRKTDSKTMLVVQRVHDQAIDALPVTMKVHFDEKTDTMDFVGGSAELAERVGTAYETYRTSYRAEDIRRTIHDAIRASRAIVLKRSGGVYFVPKKNVGPVEALARAVEQLPGTEMIALPVIDREAERKTVLKRYEAATSHRIEELMFLVQDIVTKGEPVIPSTLKRFLDELDYLREQKGEYEGLLNTTMSKVDIEMQVLEAGIGKMASLVRSK